IAMFGAGCFWGVQSAFSEVEGVTDTDVGYCGGKTKNPTYEDVCTDKTGHAEVVRVKYDPSKVSYDRLLQVFFSIHDPTQVNRQGPDEGTQYRSVIFAQDDEQAAAARSYKEKLGKSGKYKKPIATTIEPSQPFYMGEDYHQQYFARRGMKPTCHI